MSRLRRTRSTCSGAQRTGGASSSRRSSVHAARARLGLDAAHARLDEWCAAPRSQLVARARRRRCGRARRGRRRASASRRVCSWSGRRYSSGVARPSSIASSIAAIEAIGVRRSWLAAATSSRRASKRRSRFGGHLVERAAELGELARAVLGARTLEVSRGELRRRSLEPLERRAIEPPSTSAAATARGRSRGRDGENLHVVAHVEHHPAERARRASGSSDGEQRQAGELQPHRRQQPERRPSRRRRRRA